MFVVGESQPFEYLWYKLSALLVLSNDWFQLQKNKWEFFMFLILEVSAMIITGVTAVISMYTSYFFWLYSLQYERFPNLRRFCDGRNCRRSSLSSIIWWMAWLFSYIPSLGGVFSCNGSLPFLWRYNSNISSSVTGRNLANVYLFTSIITPFEVYCLDWIHISRNPWCKLISRIKSLLLFVLLVKSATMSIK
jgi:hypothetical protein